MRSGKGGFGDIKYGYAWLTYGWYMNEWWNTNDTRCNPKEIETAITRAIAIQQYPITSDKSATAIGDLVRRERREGNCIFPMCLYECN